MPVKQIKNQKSKVTRQRHPEVISGSIEIPKPFGLAQGGQVRNDKKGSAHDLSVPTYSLSGAKSGTLELPKEIFGAKVNKTLLAQALRVYQNNLKAHWGSTKTRSEVKGSTRKIRVQKGTGRARHGGIRAPIFVGGGIALGPKYRKVILDLPRKMKQAALKSALSVKMAEGEVFGVSGLEKASGKTKQLSSLQTKLGKKKLLIVIDGKNEKLSRAVGNLQGVQVLSFDQINTFRIIARQTLLLTKEAVEKLKSKAI